MIISRSPVRITLGGGGTDLPSYYSKYGGALIAAAIDKYTLVTVDRKRSRHPAHEDYRSYGFYEMDGSCFKGRARLY